MKEVSDHVADLKEDAGTYTFRLESKTFFVPKILGIFRLLGLRRWSLPYLTPCVTRLDITDRVRVRKTRARVLVQISATRCCGLVDTSSDARKNQATTCCSLSCKKRLGKLKESEGLGKFKESEGTSGNLKDETNERRRLGSYGSLAGASRDRTAQALWCGADRRGMSDCRYWKMSKGSANAACILKGSASCWPTAFFVVAP